MAKNSNNNQRNDVDIVTPVFGSPFFLKSMLDSIMSIDAGVHWSLTLVDDLGPDREKTDQVYTTFASDSRIRVVRNKQNIGFAATNNRGFSKGRAPLLLMLNSDILVKEQGWLAKMAGEFDNPSVGVVGARLLYFEKDHPNYEESKSRPPGKIQHAGVVFNLLGQPYHVYMGWDANHPKVTIRRSMNAVTGACLMTRRDMYFKVGGLDKDYGAGNFEDVQFCLQIRAMGKEVIYNPNATLYHYAGGSGNSTTAQFNETLFRIKCKNLLEFDEYRYG